MATLVVHGLITGVVTFVVTSFVWRPPNLWIEIALVAVVWVVVGVIIVAVSPGYRRRLLPGAGAGR